MDINVLFCLDLETMHYGRDDFLPRKILLNVLLILEYFITYGILVFLNIFL